MVQKMAPQKKQFIGGLYNKFQITQGNKSCEQNAAYFDNGKKLKSSTYNLQHTKGPQNLTEIVVTLALAHAHLLDILLH